MSAVRPAGTARGGRRGNLWLAALAVVQLGVLALVMLTVVRPPAPSSGPLLGKTVTVADIEAFTVTGHDGTAVTVKRDGVNWVLPDQGGFPAQTSRVEGFLEQLTALQKSGLVATTKDAYKRLQVTPDDYQRQVALTLKGGKTETLFIGSEPSYGSTHVRVASDKGVYVTHTMHASDARTDAAGYVDTTALKLDPAHVTRVAVTNAQGDLVFTRSGSSWSLQGLPSGRRLDSGAVTSLVGSLSDVQLDEPLGKKVEPAYGFAKPLAVVTLTTVTPAPLTKTTTITVGAKDKDGFYPIRISGSPYIVRVSSSSLGDVIAKKPADFLAKPAASSSSAPGASPGASPGSGPRNAGPRTVQ